MPKKSLIESVAEEREAKRKEDERRNNLKEKMEAWKEDGFVITPLENVIDGELEAAEKEFGLYEGALKKLDELNKQFSLLDTIGFEYEVQAILTKLKDPRCTTELEKDIAQIKDKIDTKRREEEKRQMELSEIEARKFAEERRKLELEAQRREDKIRALDLEKKNKEEEKRRLKAEAKKIKEMQKKAKIEAKKAEQEAKKIKLETKRKEKEKKKIEMELEVKKLEKERMKLELKVKKQEEQQKKLLERKTKEEERITKIKEEAIKQWEKEYQLKATNLISTVDGIMRSYKPEYSPLGYYLRDYDWKIELNPKKSQAIGKIYKRPLKESLKIICEYNKGFEKQFISNAKKMLLSVASSASKSQQFISKCYIIDKLDDTSAISTVESFNHPYCSIYIYDLENGRLIYNKKDNKTELFSEWFKINGKPKSMKKILFDIADNDGTFSEKDIQDKLNFDKKDMEDLIESYKKRNEVYRLIGEKDKYAFV